MSVEMDAGPNFGVSHNYDRSPRLTPPTSDILHKNAPPTPFNLIETPALPPDFVNLLGSITSPDGKKQILFILDDGTTTKGVKNPNPWSGQPERIIFRHKGPGFGNPDVHPDIWATHTFLLPEQTFNQRDSILAEIKAVAGEKPQDIAA